MFKTYLGFGDLYPIFKVTVLYVGYLLNQWMDFLQTNIDVPLGQARSGLDFGDRDLIFKVTGGHK